MKNATETEELVALRKILESKYFYKREEFKNRTRLLSFPEDTKRSSNNAICFDVFDGSPFLLAVATPEAPSKKLRDSVTRYALETETIGILVFFEADSESLDVSRRRFKDDDFETVPNLEYNYKGSSGGEMRLLEEPASYNGEDPRCGLSDLLPITNKLENIFFELHSVMRDIDGLHADAALEELCKLLYLKSFLEEQEFQLPINPVTTKSFGTTEEFASCLRALYRRANDYDLRVFRLKIPEYERSRGVFGLPFYLSSAALVKAFQLIENFTLTNSDTDVKGRAFQRVLTRSIRSGMGQYFTPAQVCELMVKIVSPTSSDLIMDPFCGSGHFLSQSLSHVRESVSEHSKEYHEFAFGKLHGIEKSDRMTRVAMTDMRLNGDGHSNIRCTDALLDFRNYPDIKAASFDVVLTNPPFGSLLGVEAFKGLATFDLAANRKKVPLEVVGLERSIEFLRPGGRIAIVLPESIFSAESCRYVREWVQERLSVRIIIDLPPETFSPFGANVRSGVMIARKRREGEKRNPSENVCMVRLDNLGYDASGRPRAGSEQKDAIKIAKSFLRKEGW